MPIAAGEIALASEVAEAFTVWQSYSPTMYTNMNTTRSSIAKTINKAKYLVRPELIIVKLDITAGATTTNGMGVSLPVFALERELACGSGAIYTGTTPTAPNTVSLGPGATTDTVMMTSYANAFIDITSGQTFRCTLMYEPV